MELHGHADHNWVTIHESGGLVVKECQTNDPCGEFNVRAISRSGTYLPNGGNLWSRVMDALSDPEVRVDLVINSQDLANHEISVCEFCASVESPLHTLFTDPNDVRTTICNKCLVEQINEMFEV